jgi:hypothetical protein
MNRRNRGHRKKDLGFFHPMPGWEELRIARIKVK